MQHSPPTRPYPPSPPPKKSKGFKNVSLGNVLSASMALKAVTFLRDDDEALYKGAGARVVCVELVGGVCEVRMLSWFVGIPPVID